ncbi:YEL023C [Saccharomyces arboricola H-6]|uniref:YEL023C n=1 Tax=Saccharomyces arboricola (strain H-6 / AS 2.3317 / CBS 10644) TaxID=1160507 RepID=J8Q667_SACAR|nr:YEL023C [Saccharomyces arboricola H-6]
MNNSKNIHKQYNKSETRGNSNIDSAPCSSFGKNIILCFDGTRENFGPQPFTSILKLYRLLENSDDSKQICYYQPGIGSVGFDAVVDVRRRLTISHVQNTLDSMFAFTLDNHICSAYLFLMKYFEPGDKIYMFGFSRGAFIARVLAGMIERVGLLNKGLEEMIEMAWQIYERWEYDSQPNELEYTSTLAEEFKKTFSREYEVKIHFQGLFDSVNSVGILRDRLFPCTQRSNIVEHVRHCVSLDERRGKFKQLCFTPMPYIPRLFSLTYGKHLSDQYSPVPSSDSSIRDVDQENPLIRYTLKSGAHSIDKISPPIPDNLGKLLSSKSEETTELLLDLNSFLESSSFARDTECSKGGIEAIFQLQSIQGSGSSSRMTMTPDLIEKWFPGDHSDVGGGWAPDCETEENLSNLPLRWILAEAIKFGVKFKRGSIHDYAAKHTSIGSLFADAHDYLDFSSPRKSSILNVKGNDGETDEQSSRNERIKHSLNNIKETRLSLKDEEEKIKDAFTLNCGHANKFMRLVWWILELLPIGIRMENKQGKWQNFHVPNLGRSRYVPDYVTLHWSIYWRIKFDRGYRPNNIPDYVRQLFQDFEGIDLKTNKLSDKYDDQSTTEGNKVNEGSSDNREPQEPHLGQKASYFATTYNARLFDAKYSQLKKKFVEWSKSSWAEIPDDLELYLQQDTSL